MEVIAKCRLVHSRLGFALQLMTVRWFGTFVAYPLDVPAVVLAYLAERQPESHSDGGHQFALRGCQVLAALVEYSPSQVKTAGPMSVNRQRRSGSREAYKDDLAVVLTSDEACRPPR